MNELILELAKQAGLKFPFETALSPQELKFAELIIKKCAGIYFRHKVVLTHDDDYAISKVILEHFGVEQ